MKNCEACPQIIFFLCKTYNLFNILSNSGTPTIPRIIVSPRTNSPYGVSRWTISPKAQFPVKTTSRVTFPRTTFLRNNVSPNLISSSHDSPNLISPSHVSPNPTFPSHVSPNLLSPSHVSPCQVSPSHVSLNLISPSIVSPNLIFPSYVSLDLISRVTFPLISFPRNLISPKLHNVSPIPISSCHVSPNLISPYFQL
jgi:hypothetical protein